MKREFILKRFIIISMFIVLAAGTAFAQGTGFNFQGRLNDGTNPANGQYDLQFRLFNAITGGAQIGSTLARPGSVLINGVFSVTLDFGATAFNNPNSIYIEIGVKPAGSPNAYTILGPRQQLTVVPFSVRATNSTNADNATNAVNATNAANSNTLNGLSSTDFIRNSTTPQPNSNFSIVGNGFINGKLSVTGSTAQNRDQGGFVKAMVYVNQFGSIVRCFNGITGSSTGQCGMSCIRQVAGFYEVRFPFQVDDRFIAVTPGSAHSVNIVASFQLNFEPNHPNSIWVTTAITDVEFVDSFTDDDFMLIVY